MINYIASTPQAVTLALRPAIRSLHLVDIENLLGGTSFGETDAVIAAASYDVVADVGPTDLVVVSSSHHTAPAAWFGWGKARHVVRSGPDGADLALIEIIDTENVAVRFDRVVIASGDKIFAQPAAQLQAAGAAVTVVSRRDSLSRQLRFATRDLRYLDLMPALGPVASRKVA